MVARKVSPSNRHSRVVRISNEYGRNGKCRTCVPEPKKCAGKVNMGVDDIRRGKRFKKGDKGAR